MFFYGFDVLFKGSFAKHNLFTFEKGNFPTRMIYFCVFQKMKKKCLGWICCENNTEKNEITRFLDLVHFHFAPVRECGDEVSGFWVFFVKHPNALVSVYKT